MGGRRRTQDHYGRRARRERYPARSIYKLEEIDRKVRLFSRGQAVLDLGAAPGSWTMYASDKVGPTGRVIAVDRAELAIGIPPNVTFMQADALAIDPSELGSAVGIARFKVVISDMAPRTSGHRFVDQTRSFNLFSRALEIALATLEPRGAFAGKIFQGEDFEKARDMVRERFEKARIIRPASVRTESYETYIVGTGLR